ncbi:MAG: dephospho-CoA kinase [Lentihominibacter sp.]
MIVLGITGGIGSGKTTAAGYLKSRGFACVDADQIGRELTADGSPLLETIDRDFGPGGKYGTGIAVIRKDSKRGVNALDRKALASVVFSDGAAKAHFDEMIHSRMLRIIREKIAEFRGRGDIRGILLDAPLMYEAGCDSMCDAVILITAPMDLRIERVMARDGTTREDVVSRINSQMSDEEKAQLADFVVDNSGDSLDMYRKLDEIVEDYSKETPNKKLR